MIVNKILNQVVRDLLMIKIVEMVNHHKDNKVVVKILVAIQGEVIKVVKI